MSDDIEFSLEEEETPKPKKTKVKKQEKQEKPQVTEIPEEEEYTKSQKKEMKDLQNDFSDFLVSNSTLEEASDTVETISTGIDVFDAFLGGGVGLGTFTMIIGNPGTFKSTIAANIMSNAQKKFDGKTLCAYLDSEESTSKARLWELGVKTPTVKPKCNVNVESVFETINAISTYKEMKGLDSPGCVIWDSIANTITRKEMEDKDLTPEQVMGLKARIIASYLPRYVSSMKKDNISLIAINQLRDKIDISQKFKKANDIKWLGDKNIPGGNSLKFNAFHLIHLKQMADLDVEKYGFNGFKLAVRCVKNKLFVPNVTFELLVDFNTGISNFWTNYEFMKNCGFIKASAWSSLAAHPDKKWNGYGKCKQFYDTDLEFRNMFDEQAKDAIKLNIIDK